jgi:hypothetical protein
MAYLRFHLQKNKAIFKNVNYGKIKIMKKKLVRWPEDKKEPPTPGQMSVELIYNGVHYIMPFDENAELRKYMAEKDPEQYGTIKEHRN